MTVSHGSCLRTHRTCVPSSFSTFTVPPSNERVLSYEYWRHVTGRFRTGSRSNANGVLFNGLCQPRNSIFTEVKVDTRGISKVPSWSSPMTVVALNKFEQTMSFLAIVFSNTHHTCESSSSHAVGRIRKRSEFFRGGRRFRNTDREIPARTRRACQRNAVTRPEKATLACPQNYKSLTQLTVATRGRQQVT